MKLRKLVSSFLILTMFILTYMNSFAAEVDEETYALRNANLQGIIHEDGSYQFSQLELERLNKFTSKNGENYNLATAISYAAPQFYECLSTESKETLNVNQVVATAAHSCTTDYSYIHGCTVSISKYGSSLKGVSTIKRTTTTGVPESLDGYYVVNEIYNNRNARVGYSVNVSMTANVSATTIVDPPSGTYTSYGIFQIPYNCPDCYQWTRISGNAETSAFSYVNPNA